MSFCAIAVNSDSVRSRLPKAVSLTGGMMKRDATECNSIRQNKYSTALLAIFILLVPILILTGASPAPAARERKADINQTGADTRLESDKDLSKGRFLIAGRRLLDPNFKQTVVLLIRYGTDGAMGVVINRPIQVKLSTVIPEIKELKSSQENLYLGGPVEQSKMILLMKSAKPPPDSMEVFGEVYLTSSREELRRLVTGTDDEEKFRVFAGYAGWAPGQLDAEHGRGDWHVLNADAGTLFDKESTEIWQELIHHFTVKWVNLKLSELPE